MQSNLSSTCHTSKYNSLCFALSPPAATLIEVLSWFVASQHLPRWQAKQFSQKCGETLMLSILILATEGGLLEIKPSCNPIISIPGQGIDMAIMSGEPSRSKDICQVALLIIVGLLHELHGQRKCLPWNLKIQCLKWSFRHRNFLDSEQRTSIQSLKVRSIYEASASVQIWIFASSRTSCLNPWQSRQLHGMSKHWSCYIWPLQHLRAQNNMCNVLG